MKKKTVALAVELRNALVYDEGEVSFEEGTAEYAILDALSQNDQVSGEIDARLGNVFGTNKASWNITSLSPPEVAPTE